KRGRDLIFIDELQNTRQPALGPKIGSRKSGGRGLPGGQQVRLVIDVEAEADCDARIARPGFRRQLAADAGGGDCLAKWIICPSYVWLRVLTLLRRPGS